MEQLTWSMGLPHLWICVAFTRLVPGQGTGMLWEISSWCSLAPEPPGMAGGGCLRRFGDAQRGSCAGGLNLIPPRPPSQLETEPDLGLINPREGFVPLWKCRTRPPQ